MNNKCLERYTRRRSYIIQGRIENVRMGQNVGPFWP